MIRFVFFSVLTAISLTLPWPVFVLLALVYAFMYEGVELIVLGFMLDAYMGYSGPWLPLNAAYSIAMMGMLICMWGLKPLIQTNRNDSWNPS